MQGLDPLSQTALPSLLVSFNYAVECLGQRRLLDTAKLLLDKGASMSIKDKWGRTPLHICLAHNPGTIDSSVKLEELFLSYSTAEVDEKDFLGRVPLHYAYFGLHSRKKETDPTSLTSLMTHHSREPLALVNFRDHKMVTPLHMAAAIGAGVSCIHLIQVRLSSTRI